MLWTRGRHFRDARRGTARGAARGGRRPSRSPSPRTRAKAAAGGKRFVRDGCYQIESGGGTGGPGCARQPGRLPSPRRRRGGVRQLDAIGADALVREGAAEGGAAPGRSGASRRRAAPAGLRPGDSQIAGRPVRPDGSRWVAANQTAANQLLRRDQRAASENQWYATPPAKPVGAGAQLVVLSVMIPGRDGSRRTEAALASDGRWWCYRSVVGERGAEPQAAGETKPRRSTDAPARLGRILAGASPRRRDEAPADPDKRTDGVEISVEVAWPGVARAPLRPDGAGRRAWPIASAPRCKPCRRRARSRTRPNPR